MADTSSSLKQGIRSSQGNWNTMDFPEWIKHQQSENTMGHLWQTLDCKEDSLGTTGHPTPKGQDLREDVFSIRGSLLWVLQRLLDGI